MFQSLDRAYKRSDSMVAGAASAHVNGFNPSIGLTSVPTVSVGSGTASFNSFNPSIGLTSVPTNFEYFG